MNEEEDDIFDAVRHYRKEHPVNENADKDFSGIINKMKMYLIEYYEPVYSAKDADFHYTTDEIYRQLQRILCNELIYSAADVALWLHNTGFTFEDFGELRFEWLMKRRVQ